ncbi:MAG TPA: peptidoglycan editing factor PgeF [Candidatus Kryptonia bacterium]|nr:peptidoglycan editing factor PgeF [Candidatus Kryptonia bacterium]
MAEIPVLRVLSWHDIPGLAHGFFGRAGGVSSGDFARLNLSERVGDEPAAVAENRRRVGEQLAIQGHLTWMQQVHGDQVTILHSSSQAVGAADGLISTERGTLLAVLTADCVPALLVAPRRRVVAAVHAGWRGTLAGIVIRAVTMLRETFEVDPEESEVALGPASDGCCYEVEREVGERFAREWGTLPLATWRASGAKGWLDLRRINAGLLRRAGVRAARIHLVGPCTRCASADYFSHRGSRGRSGRQLSYVGWAI